MILDMGSPNITTMLVSGKEKRCLMGHNVLTIKIIQYFLMFRGRVTVRLITFDKMYYRVTAMIPIKSQGNSLSIPVDTFLKRFIFRHNEYKVPMPNIILKI